MLIEEEEGKPAAEVNPEAFEAMFEDDSAVEEEIIMFRSSEEGDEVDLAFTEDEGYW